MAASNKDTAANLKRAVDRLPANLARAVTQAAKNKPKP
jgi:hypothetical protein